MQNDQDALSPQGSHFYDAWFRRLGAWYACSIAAIITIGLVVWTTFVVAGWDSPLRANANYEALFFILHALFVGFPLAILTGPRLPQRLSSWTRNTHLARIYFLIVVGVSYLLLREVVLGLHLIILDLALR